MENVHRNSLPLFSLAIGLVLTTAFSGCKSTQPASSDAAANPATAQSQPAAPSAQPGGTAGAPQAAPSGPAARAAAPVAEKPAPVKVTLTVAPGTDVNVRINETINAKTANVGDPFTGVLSAPLATPSGQTVFAKGTTVSGTVVSAKGQGRFAGAGALAIELSEIGGHRVSATEYVVSKKGKGKRTAALIGGGAGVGALVGGLLGGGKGAAIGGLVGGGAGTAGAGLSGNQNLVIPTESIVIFEVSQPISITREK